MYSTLLYVATALLILDAATFTRASEAAFLECLGAGLLLWALFFYYSLRRGRKLLLSTAHAGEAGGGRRSPGVAYQRARTWLSLLALCLFAFDVLLLDLPFWIAQVPGADAGDTLNGLAAMALFYLYLATFWYALYPAHRAIFGLDVTRRAFVLGQLRLSLPILVPWVLLSLGFSLLARGPEEWVSPILDSQWGQMLFAGVLLVLTSLFMPVLLTRFWACRPFPPSWKIENLEGFLREKGFSYRALLRWPAFEGKEMTAGLMGIVPGLRYILVTDALLEALSTEELRAVLAHEMGHARYRHLLLYILFFLGMLPVAIGAADIVPVLALGIPWIPDLFYRAVAEGYWVQNLLSALSLALFLLGYFRFLIGFFMRHFERQADLYSARVMGTPLPTIHSLEKIALWSGKIRDLPSWHHFSIRERVDTLWRSLEEPGMLERQGQFLRRSLLVCASLLLGLGVLLNTGDWQERARMVLGERVLTLLAEKDPEDLPLSREIAAIYLRMERYAEAGALYERILSRDPSDATSLNNLAWLLLTDPGDGRRQPARALELAEMAVAEERNPAYLDTLAEAYYQMGDSRKAEETIEEALALAEENIAYYERQRDKFKNTQSI